MIYGYCRCSTNESRQDINRQVRELNGLGVKTENIYTEYASGTNANRIELKRLMNVVNGGDTIVVTEISRISRSTKQLIDIIDIVKEKQLKLVIRGSLTIDCTCGKNMDSMSRAFIQIAAVFAELERNMICDRVNSGLENAKSKGVKLGRPTITKENIPAVFYRYYPAYTSKKVNASEFAKLCGLSRTTLYKYLKVVTS